MKSFSILDMQMHACLFRIRSKHVSLFPVSLESTRDIFERVSRHVREHSIIQSRRSVTNLTTYFLLPLRFIPYFGIISQR